MFFCCCYCSFSFAYSKGEIRAHLMVYGKNSKKWLRNWKHGTKDNYRRQILQVHRMDRNQSTAGVLTLDIGSQKIKRRKHRCWYNFCWVQKLNDLSSGFFFSLSCSLSPYPSETKGKLCFEWKGGENGSLQESRELLNNCIRNGKAVDLCWL